MTKSASKKSKSERKENFDQAEPTRKPLTRRHFVKATVLLGVGAVLDKCLPSSAGEMTLAQGPAPETTPQVFLPIITNNHQPPASGPTTEPTPQPTPQPTPDPDGTSAIYRVNNCPTPTQTVPNWYTAPSASQIHAGVETLLDLMGSNGLKFYQTATTSQRGGPNGLIAADDVVVIKINAQWNKRGMTNTDVFRGLVKAITGHPDGFTGEIVVADNVQGLSGGYFTSATQNNDDSSDHGQSIDDVVALFSEAYSISRFAWTPLSPHNQSQFVAEFESGDNTDGYVRINTDNIFRNYAKFTTAYGTRISMLRGIWNSSSYDSSRLKLINLPVLKPHGGFGATVCVKNYMGFISLLWPNENSFLAHSDAAHGIQSGVLGDVMGRQNCFPTLNLLDAIYVAFASNTPGWNADNKRVLMASTDPTELDYYATRYVLLPVMQAHLPPGDWRINSADPENPSGMFRGYMLASQAALQGHGRATHFSNDGFTLYETSVV